MATMELDVAELLEHGGKIVAPPKFATYPEAHATGTDVKVVILHPVPDKLQGAAAKLVAAKRTARVFTEEVGYFLPARDTGKVSKDKRRILVSPFIPLILADDFGVWPRQ